MTNDNPIAITLSLPRTPAVFITADRGHERYQLRSIGLVAAYIAIPLNIIASICASSKSITIIHSVALIPLLFIIAWSHIDLFYPPQLLRSGLSTILLLLFDTALFLGFLALLIANGITIRNRYCDPKIILYSYASVPWLVICTIELLLAGLTLLKLSGLVRLHSSRCNCGHHHSGTRAGKERLLYTPLSSQEDDEEVIFGPEEEKGGS